MSTNNDLPIVPRGPRRDDTYTFDILNLNEKGHGVAFYEALVGPQQQLKKYRFVIRGSVPGDRVAVRVTNDSRRSREAKIVEVLSPSEDRIEARCPHTSIEAELQCGGCVGQAMSYEAQLKTKHAALGRRLLQHGIDAPMQPVQGMESPWRFRNKMEWSFGELPDGTMGIGLHPPGFRYEVIDHEACFICEPSMLELGELFAVWARDHDLKVHRRDEGTVTSVAIRLSRLGHAQCTLKSRAPVEPSMLENLASRLPEEATLFHTIVDAERGRPTIETTTVIKPGVWREQIEVLGKTYTFEVEPAAFFQTNTIQTEVLYALAVEAAKECVGETANVWDLYCGCGTITAVLADHFKTVVGIEVVEASIVSAKRNLKLNNIENVSFVLGDASAIFADTAPPDLIVVDPPRAGLSKQVIEGLIQLKVPIVYVSCNPKTLAADLEQLCESAFDVVRIQPVDMFPHTSHVETIVTAIPKPS